MHLRALLCGLLLVCGLVLFGRKVCAEESKTRYERVVDSLKKELLHPIPDTVRVRILSLLLKELKYSSPDEALVLGKEALQLAKQSQLTFDEATIELRLGLVYIDKADYKMALLSTLNSLRLFGVLNSDYGKASAYNNLGIIYYNLHRYDLAKGYYIKAFNLYKLSGRQKELSAIYSNIGNILGDEGKLRESIPYYRWALDNSIERKDTTGIYVILANLSGVYFDLNSFDTARIFLNRSLSLTRNRSEYNRYLASALLELAELELKAHNPERALRYGLRSSKIIHYCGTMDSRLSLYLLMAKIYKEQGNSPLAFKYYEDYNTLKDSVFSLTIADKISQIQKGHEIQERDREIQLLSQREETAKAQAESQLAFRNLLIAIFIFVLITSGVVARNLVLKQRVRNKVLNEEKIIVEAEKKQAENNIVRLLHENTEARYETLKSKVNPHFLFNSLNVLSSIVEEDQSQAVEYIEKFSGFYRLILKTGNESLVSLENEMQLVNNYFYLQKMWYGDKLIIHIDIRPHSFEVFLPPFAIQMMVENAIKHNTITRSERLTIRIAVTEDISEVWIVNNLQRRQEDIFSTFTGQKSVFERYALLTELKPEMMERNGEYIVRLPLLSVAERTPLHLRMKETIL